jgi:hypothetical protein
MPQEENNRLDSWKAISQYLGKDVTTLIRWEKERGLPVHRIPGAKRSLIFAHKDELDQWLRFGSRGLGTQGLGSEGPGSLAQRDAPPLPNRDTAGIVPEGAGSKAPADRTTGGETGAHAQSGTAFSGDVPVALTGEAKPYQAQGAVSPKASSDLSRGGWASALWIGVAVCIIFLLCAG